MMANDQTIDAQKNDGKTSLGPVETTPILKNDPAQITKSIEEQQPDDTDSVDESRWERFRSSQNLVIAVGFFSLFIDSSLKTGLCPIFPVMVADINGVSYDSLNMSDVLNHTGVLLRQTMRSETVIIVLIHPLLEFVFSIIAGFSVDRIGPKIPLIIGTVLTGLVAMGMAFAPTFWLLCLFRATAGAACAFSSVPALALISARFPKDEYRTRAIGMASAGQVLGGNIGSSLMLVQYQFFGRVAPFIYIAVFCAIDGALRVIIKDKMAKQVTAVWVCGKGWCGVGDCMYQCRDLYVTLLLILATGAAYVRLTRASLVYEWQIHDLSGTLWQIAVISFVGGIISIIAIQITRYHVKLRCSKGNLVCVGFVGTVIACVTYPLSADIWISAIPDFLFRLFFTIVWLSLTAICGLITNDRHPGKHGILFGFLQASFNLGRVIGGSVAILFIKDLRFRGIMYVTAAFAGACAFPALLFNKLE